MTLRQLEYFVTLASIQHYTRAAEQLMISQPSLSNTIAALEKELGVTLFDRTGKQVVLTEPGAVFYAGAQQALELLEEARIAVQVGHTDSQRVRIGYLHSCASQLTPLLRSFSAAQEGRAIQVETQIFNADRALSEALELNRLDLAVVLDPGPGTEAEPLLQQKIVAVVGNEHPLAQHESVTFSQLLALPLVMVRPGERFNQPILDAYRAAGAKPNIAICAPDFSVAFAYLSDGQRCFLSPEMPVDLANYQALPISDMDLSRTVYLVYRSRALLTPAADRLRQFLLAQRAQPL